MPSPWNNIKVGDPILTDNHFETGFHSDFTQPLDGGANPGGILGTSAGYSGDQFNFTYPTDGQFKVGGHLQFHQNYAQSYNFPFASDQRNKEPMHIVHFYGNADPTGFGPVNPDPMSFFSVDSGILTMIGRPTTEAEKAWARIKGYAINENGKEASYGWFKANGGVPADWEPTSMTPPQKRDELGNLMFNDSGAPVPDDNALVYFFNMPAEYACPMISTYNRCSMSFGRSMARVVLPFGAKSDGPTTNLRNIQTWFPAFWDLEDVPARCDINGRLHDKDTYTPGNPAGQGILNELDQIEIFGYEAKQHVTSHHYLDGFTEVVDGVRRTKRIQRNHGMVGNAYSDPIITNTISRGVFCEVGVDRFPPYEDEPGVIAYHFNGVYCAVYEMPDYLGQPKILYEPRTDIPYVPVLNDDFTIKRLGSQVYEDGNPAYTHWCQIFNIAMSAGFTRSQAVSSLNNGTAPSFAEQEEYKIEWTRMDPLKMEYGNPDTKAFIDYKAGDFGGSSSTLSGPTYERFSTGHNNNGSVVIGDGSTDPVDPTEPTTPTEPALVGTAIGVFGVRVNGNDIHLPTNDWYLVETSIGEEVYRGSGNIKILSLPNGKYSVLNLINNTRTDNITLPASIIVPSEGGTENVTDSDTYPTSPVSVFTTYHAIADMPNGGKVLVPSGRYG